MIRYIISGMLLLFLCISCKDDKVENMEELEGQKKFLVQTVPGAYKGGTALWVYQQGEYQIAFSSSGKSWRMQTDTQDKYIACELEEMPQIEKQMNISVKSKGVPGVTTGDFNSKILKIEEGKCWMWISVSGIGVLMRVK